MKKAFTALTIIAILVTAGALFLRSEPFDEQTFNTKLEQVQANDQLATSIFNVPEDVSSQDYAQTARGGIALYESSLTLLEEMRNQASVPAEQQKLTIDIEQYTELRIQQFDLLARGAEEDTQEYFPEVTDLADRISKLAIYERGSVLETLERETQ